MELFVVSLAACGASLLTLFSGFGLGTLLLPVFALFFSPEAAIAATALVHLCNNLFKLTLLGKHADREVLLRFGIPALFAAGLGALALGWLSDLPLLGRYELGARTFEVSPLKLAVGAALFAFALFDLLPQFRDLALPRKYLALGGGLSGFFGGLSGHQGALRSAFLAKCGLSKEAFLGSGIAIACAVDLVRLSVYGVSLSWSHLVERPDLVAAGVLAAIAGAWLGARLIPKTTIRGIQLFVGAGVALFAVALAAGFIGGHNT